MEKAKRSKQESIVSSRTAVSKTLFEKSGLPAEGGRVELGQAIKNRDAILLATISTAFQKTQFNEEQRMELIKLVRDAFHKGALDWDQKYFEFAVGPEEAERIKSAFGGPSGKPRLRSKADKPTSRKGL